MYNFGIRQPQTGYRIAYRQEEANHCPGCGQSQWILGRMTAECACCGTALPLRVGGSFGYGLFRSRGLSGFRPLAA